MNRINIVGNSGSGKTSLAIELANKLGIPNFHLDGYFWQDGWKIISKEEQLKIVTKIIDNDSWIIEGNYHDTLDLRFLKCDTIVFLDVPLFKCLSRVLKRSFKFSGKSREELPVGCIDKFWNLKLYQYLLFFNIRRKKLILQKIFNLNKDVNIVLLTSDKSIKKFLSL